MVRPFGSPALAVEDSLRLVVLAAFTVLLFVNLKVLVNRRNRRFTNATPWGLWSQVAMGAYVAGTELLRLGHGAGEGWWRLPLALAAMLLAVRTTLEVRRYPQDELPRWTPGEE